MLGKEKSKMRTFLVPLLTLFTFISLNAQTETGFMRSGGKIYVVVGVLLIILIGFFIYLWRLDRSITEIEESINE